MTNGPDSHESIEPIEQPSRSSPGQPSAAASPWSAFVQVASQLVSGGVSLAVASKVLSAWQSGLIPDWKYALAALIAVAMPTQAVGLAKIAVRRALGGKQS